MPVLIVIQVNFRLMEYQSVLSIAPLRISFLGGGTDIQYFYKKYQGKVISAAINKYVYVHIKKHDPLFQERYRISYSEVEHTQSRSDIKNSIVRSCLEFLEIDEPLQISTSADLPTNSGLGSSSSFTVALLLGLHKMTGKNISSAQIAEEACQIEIEILGNPIGKQDQYAAAFGGLNYYEFLSDGTVKIQPLMMEKNNSVKLLENSLLFWTGASRDSTKVLSDQAKNFQSNENSLVAMTELVDQFKSTLLNSQSELIQLGGLITSGWELKQTFSSLIMTYETQDIINEISKNNCVGFKLLGAGAGGFVYALFPQDDKKINKFSPKWRTFQPELDTLGARVVSSF
jgi:D-glycero-alpha-D-manno-heptose-7-phosphate kinase